MVALVVLALAGPGIPAVAATPAGAITVAAVPADSGDLAAGAALRLFVSLTNGTTAATEAATVSVSVAGAPVANSSTLADWFSGANKTNLAARAVGTASFPLVAGGLSSGVPVTIPAASLPFGAAGVYPVSVTIATAGKTLGEARSAVAWNVSSPTAVPVAVAVALTVPAGESTFLTAAELSTYTAPGGMLTREIGDIQNQAVAVGIDPRILASIRVLGNGAPQSARDWLDQLRALPNETFPLAWADADVTAPLHAGESSILETKSLDYAIDPSQFPVDQTPPGGTPTPTPTSGPTTPVVPTSATLVAWNYTLPLLSWPAENSVVTSDLAKLDQSGLTSAILASTNVTQPGNAGASAKVGNTTLAISDSVLSGYLRTAIQSTVRAASSEALTELTTSLALVSREAGGSPPTVLLTLGRNWATADTNFERSVSEISAHSWSTPTTLAGILTASPVTTTIAKKTQSSSRIALVTSMLAAERSIVSFAPIAKAPDILTSSTRLQLLSLLSNEWTPTSWLTAGRAFLVQSDKVVGSVKVDPSNEILAIADQTSLPVSVSNGLDQDVTVSLVVASLSTRVTLDKKDTVQTVTVDEGAQKRILIPMSALSNGKASIVVTLRSSTGIQIGKSVTININVQAGWETAGTLIFAALIVGLFAFGIIRTIRARRKAAHSSDAT
ncbi:MAG: hypothetical protein QOH69_1182 [Actinomycetota bacterium]|jgi:hypothetical protein|nr:hypothetical protein [Actinomycetota bacterium]